MRNLILRPGVSDDLAEQCDWYDAQESGLGAEVEHEFWNALRRIQSAPESFPKTYVDFRRCFIKRFHFHVYFQVTESEMVIVMMRDARRNDRPIRELLRNR